MLESYWLARVCTLGAYSKWQGREAEGDRGPVILQNDKAAQGEATTAGVLCG